MLRRVLILLCAVSMSVGLITSDASAAYLYRNDSTSYGTGSCTVKTNGQYASSHAFFEVDKSQYGWVGKVMGLIPQGTADTCTQVSSAEICNQNYQEPTIDCHGYSHCEGDYSATASLSKLIVTLKGVAVISIGEDLNIHWLEGWSTCNGVQMHWYVEGGYIYATVYFPSADPISFYADGTLNAENDVVYEVSYEFAFDPGETFGAVTEAWAGSNATDPTKVGSATSLVIMDID